MCNPYQQNCGTDQYWDVFIMIWFFVPFLVVAGTGGNLMSRKLLLRTWVVGFAVILAMTTVFAVVWMPMEFTKTMMCDPMPRTGWPCEIQEDNPAKIFGGGDLTQADLENFSVADDGTTMMKGIEDLSGATFASYSDSWNGATFSSEREPHCPGYHQFTNWRDGDGMFDCRSVMGTFVFLGFLWFYIVDVPVTLYFIYKMMQYVMEA